MIFNVEMSFALCMHFRYAVRMHQFNFRALICLKDCFNAYLAAFVPWLSCDVLSEPFCALTNRIVAFLYARSRRKYPNSADQNFPEQGNLMKSMGLAYCQSTQK